MNEELLKEPAPSQMTLPHWWGKRLQNRSEYEINSENTTQQNMSSHTIRVIRGYWHDDEKEMFIFPGGIQRLIDERAGGESRRAKR